jgi:general stress protein 26
MSDKTPEETVRSIMESTRIASLTYVDSVGRLVATPMGTQKFEDPRLTYWITERDSDKVAHLRADPRVNVFYAGGDGYVSLTGSAHLVEDEARLKSLWGFFTDSFMEEGPEHPNSALLEVIAESAQWWDTPGAVATAVALVKGKVTDDETDLGESGIVSL